MSLLDLITDGNNDDSAKTMDSIELSLDLISADPNNPRKFISEKKDEEMVESIKERGIAQPIVVIRDPNDSTRYIVKAGNRRRRNAIKAGLKTIPAVVKDEFSELDQLTENVMRDDMTVLDLSRSINNLISNKIAKQKEIGKALGFSEAKTSKYVALTKDVHECITDNLETLHNRGLANDFSAMYEIATLSKEHQEDVILWLDKHTASGKSLGMADVKKLKEKFLIDEEKASQDKDKTPEYNEKVVIDITVKGKESLDRISKLSKGEITDPDEREEILNELAEFIKDLQIIKKQYK